MKNPEVMGVMVLVALAVLVVAADVVVRLVVLPGQKDRFTRELLDHLVEVGVALEAVGSSVASTALPARDLHESLLRHFEKSGMSRRILGALADSDGLTQRDLVRVLEGALAKKGGSLLPAAVSQRVAMILLDAGLLEVKDGVLRITHLGRSLNDLLQARTLHVPSTQNGAGCLA